MRSIFVIKTNVDSVVTEYHEYHELPSADWKPSPDHLLVEKPEVDPVGHVYTAGGVPPFSKEYAPGFEPDAD